jgi:hypothetical protein
MLKTQFFVFIVIALLPGFSGLADEQATLEWSICDSSPESVLQKLAVSDADPSKSVEATYYDSNPPTYVQQGIEFRTKLKKNENESLVKIRLPGGPASATAGDDCQWERYGSNEVYACQAQSDADQGETPWSPDQTAFASRYASVNWNSLVAFGPYANPKWLVNIAGQNGVFDSVETPVAHLMELEIQIPQTSEDVVYSSVTDALNQAGVELCVVQEGNTFRLFKGMGLLPN